MSLNGARQKMSFALSAREIFHRRNFLVRANREFPVNEKEKKNLDLKKNVFFIVAECDKLLWPFSNKKKWQRQNRKKKFVEKLFNTAKVVSVSPTF